MTNDIIVGLLSLGGTLCGTFAGILTSTKLTNYRIEQLEKKVEKHNSVVERTALLERDMKTVWHNIDEMKEDIREEVAHE
jgi:hypothetical protein